MGRLIKDWAPDGIPVGAQRKLWCASTADSWSRDQLSRQAALDLLPKIQEYPVLYVASYTTVALPGYATGLYFDRHAPTLDAEDCDLSWGLEVQVTPDGQRL